MHTERCGERVIDQEQEIDSGKEKVRNFERDVERKIER